MHSEREKQNHSQGSASSENYGLVTTEEWHREVKGSIKGPVPSMKNAEQTV